MNIAIFGTSADPPTIAHQSILKYLSANFDLSLVYASDNPFKEHGSSLEDRYEMLRLLVEDLHLPPDNLQLAPEISDRRTINTIERVKRRWGRNSQITVTIGSDLVNQILRWYEAEKLWTQVKILIIPRQGYNLTESNLKPIRAITPKLTIAPIIMEGVSSTHYRENYDSGVLTAKVKAYIKQQGLYVDEGEKH